MNRHCRTYVALASIAVAAACSKGADTTPSTPPAGQPAAAPSASVTPTGKTIVVELFTDEKGNYFKPNKIEAHRGDLIKFTLGAGVHNVHFLPDSNPGAKDLPPASDFLQLPGQTFDFLVALAPGKYYFQCDPHALLGMQGHLEVEDGK